MRSKTQRRAVSGQPNALVGQRSFERAHPLVASRHWVGVLAVKKVIKGNTDAFEKGAAIVCCEG